MARWFVTLVIVGLLAGCGSDEASRPQEPATPDEATLEAHDDEVSRRIKAGKADVRACGMAESTGGETLMGKLQVSFEIKEDGSVGTVNVDENSTGDAAVGTCASGVIARWEFPAHPAGEAVQFTYPFEIGPEL